MAHHDSFPHPFLLDCVHQVLLCTTGPPVSSVTALWCIVMQTTYTLYYGFTVVTQIIVATVRDGWCAVISVSARSETFARLLLFSSTWCIFSSRRRSDPTSESFNIYGMQGIKGQIAFAHIIEACTRTVQSPQVYGCRRHQCGSARPQDEEHEGNVHDKSSTKVNMRSATHHCFTPMHR